MIIGKALITNSRPNPQTAGAGYYAQPAQYYSTPAPQAPYIYNSQRKFNPIVINSKFKNDSYFFIKLEMYIQPYQTPIQQNYPSILSSPN